MSNQETSEKPRVIAIAGTTASGKTRLSIDLASLLGSEIISSDSQLVYQGLDIGTAKPTLSERRGIPHHLIDCVAPSEKFTVAMYVQAAQPILEALIESGKTPIVVGGTGFYLRALLQQQQYPQVPPDPDFRQQMKALSETHGPEYLYRLLQLKDPRRAAMLYPQDGFRIVRALEIIEKTGEPVPDVTEACPYDLLWIGLGYANRETMRQAINDRIDTMIAVGWLEEVQKLITEFGPNAHALQVSHGYPEWVRHLEGELEFSKARDQIRLNIHQYARRQLTWFRNQAPIEHWFYVDEVTQEVLLERVSKIIRDR